MATTYIPADDEAHRLMAEIVAEHRRDLLKHDVKICLLFALASKPGVPAMKHKGQTVNGWCRVNPYADRVEGKADATICLDGDRWAGWGEARRRALIHHELLHIAYCDGRLDEAGRPALKARYGDWHFDGFHDVLKLYGVHSGEHRNLSAVLSRHGQGDLPFGGAEEAEAEGEGAGPVPAAPEIVSFSGGDFAVAHEAGKRLRGRRAASSEADETS